MFVDRDIEKLLNPPWLDAIRKLEKQTSIYSLALHESAAMKSIINLAESARLPSLSFNETPALKSIRELAELSCIGGPHNSELLQNIKTFSASRLA